jgi:hypothetical protein
MEQTRKAKGFMAARVCVFPKKKVFLAEAKKGKTFRHHVKYENDEAQTRSESSIESFIIESDD